MDSSGESKNPNLEDLMRLGASTAKAGNKDNARVIFRQVLDADKRNVGAWLWMASLAENNIDRRRYLETVLQLSPNNATARKQLAVMDRTVQRGENASLRLGIIILVILVFAVVAVGVAVLVITRLPK
jgi:hypothetical protein